MRQITISISDTELDKFGIKESNLTFSDFIEIVKCELMRQNLKACVDLAEKYGLSSMTMEDIDKEIKEVRDAKTRR